MERGCIEIRRLWSFNEIRKIFGLEPAQNDTFKKMWSLNEIRKIGGLELEELDTMRRMWSRDELIDILSSDPKGIPARYVQTTTADFNASGDYTGTEEYIILPEDKTSGYKIVNLNVKGVATDGDYLTNISDMFSGNPSLYLELDYLNTSNVTNMFSMFQSSQATTLDLSSFDTSSVTNMGSMFQSSQATTLDLSSFDTSSVTNMSYMFQRSQATTLDLSSFDTSSVISNIIENMFNGSKVTTGYARTQTDANKFNSSSGKPSALTFVVK